MLRITSQPSLWASKKPGYWISQGILVYFFAANTIAERMRVTIKWGLNLFFVGKKWWSRKRERELYKGHDRVMEIRALKISTFFQVCFFNKNHSYKHHCDLGIHFPQAMFQFSLVIYKYLKMGAVLSPKLLLGM